MKTYDVAALGELLIDFAPHSVNEAGYPVLSANPGGAPGNFLAALNKYGCKSAMIGKVGDDLFGRLLEGAGSFAQFWKVTLPMLTPMILLNTFGLYGSGCFSAAMRLAIHQLRGRNHCDPHHGLRHHPL